MWKPEIQCPDENPDLIWVASPHEMPRPSRDLDGWPVMVKGIRRVVASIYTDSGVVPDPIKKGERICLKLWPITAAELSLGASAP